MAFVDPTTQLKLKNPLIELSLLQKSIKARNVKTLRVLGSSGQASGGFEVDTCGCLVSKSPEKKTARGDIFSVWRLSDLDTMQSSCTVLMFRDAHEAHARVPLGTVLLILGGSAMEGGSEERKSTTDGAPPVSVSVNESWQVVRLGEALDFGICRGTRKDGLGCSVPVNKSLGGYCRYHLSSSGGGGASFKPQGQQPQPQGFQTKFGKMLATRHNSNGPSGGAKGSTSGGGAGGKGKGGVLAVARGGVFAGGGSLAIPSSRFGGCSAAVGGKGGKGKGACGGGGGCGLGRGGPSLAAAPSRPGSQHRGGSGGASLSALAAAGLGAKGTPGCKGGGGAMNSNNAPRSYSKQLGPIGESLQRNRTTTPSSSLLSSSAPRVDQHRTGSPPSSSSSPSTLTSSSSGINKNFKPSSSALSTTPHSRAQAAPSASSCLSPLDVNADMVEQELREDTEGGEEEEDEEWERCLEEAEAEEEQKRKEQELKFQLKLKRSRDEEEDPLGALLASPSSTTSSSKRRMPQPPPTSIASTGISSSSSSSSSGGGGSSRSNEKEASVSVGGGRRSGGGGNRTGSARVGDKDGGGGASGGGGGSTGGAVDDGSRRDGHVAVPAPSRVFELGLKRQRQQHQQQQQHQHHGQYPQQQHQQQQHQQQKTPSSQHRLLPHPPSSSELELAELYGSEYQAKQELARAHAGTLCGGGTATDLENDRKDMLANQARAAHLLKASSSSGSSSKGFGAKLGGSNTHVGIGGTGGGAGGGGSGCGGASSGGGSDQGAALRSRLAVQQRALAARSAAADFMKGVQPVSGGGRQQQQQQQQQAPPSALALAMGGLLNGVSGGMPGGGAGEKIGGVSNLSSSSSSSSPSNKPQAAAAAAARGLPAHLAALLTAKSKHCEGAREEDRVASFKALDRLEYRDALEADKEKVVEEQVRAYHCDQCHSTTTHVPGGCSLAAHHVRSVKAFRRFFECTSCRTRTSTLSRSASSQASSQASSSQASSQAVVRPPPRCRKCAGQGKVGSWKRCGAGKAQGSVLKSRSDGLLLSLSEQTSYSDALSSAKDAVAEF